MPYHHILFPIDFSEQCELLVPSVKAMASHYRARLTLLHCFEIPMGWYAYTEPGLSAGLVNLREIENQARTRLSAFRDKFFSTENPQTILEEDYPAASIMRRLNSLDVDLIMMGTQGYGPFKRAVLGSVTSRILQEAQCAVWTAAHSLAIIRQIPPYKRILCAISETSRSVHVLKAASQLAVEMGASLQLVHSFPMRSGDSAAERYDNPPSPALGQLLQTELDQLQKAAGTHAPLTVAGGSVEEVVEEAVKRYDADVVVIGRGHLRNTFGSLFSSVFGIVRSANRPVISI
jgi:nucleotide-binding universal stress UspA family protein